jgi:hypothetical protein
MGGQIILTTDPSGLSTPFLSNETKQMCLNASEWIATQRLKMLHFNWDARCW